MTPSDPSAVADVMRRSFDRSFATAPPTAHAAPRADLLVVRVAGDLYALRLAHVAGLHARRRIVPLPSRAPELLGIAGFRGAVLPVYGLRGLLGYPAGDPPCWFVLAAGTEPIALAFDRFEGHVRVAASELTPTASRSERRHVRDVVRSGALLLPVVDVPSLVDAIRTRTLARTEESHT